MPADVSRILTVVSILVLLASNVSAREGGEISEISFDTIPVDVTMVADAITLQGDVLIEEDLVVTGSVAAMTSGYSFPDGTMQTTAARGAEGVSANNGLYGNRIVDFSPPLAFTEVCIVGGSISVDIHAMGETTNGGNCVPGDVGWVMERNQRAPATWEAARMECLLNEMRLPETFEFIYSCVEDATLGLNDMTGDDEWASNSAISSFSTGGVRGMVVPSVGLNACDRGDRYWVARSDGVGGESIPFRCVR